MRAKSEIDTDTQTVGQRIKIVFQLSHNIFVFYSNRWLICYCATAMCFLLLAGWLAGWCGGAPRHTRISFDYKIVRIGCGSISERDNTISTTNDSRRAIVRFVCRVVCIIYRWILRWIRVFLRVTFRFRFIFDSILIVCAARMDPLVVHTHTLGHENSKFSHTPRRRTHSLRTRHSRSKCLLWRLGYPEKFVVSLSSHA